MDKADSASPDLLSREQAASLLQYYAEAGVIDLLDDAPVDRYVQSVQLLEEHKNRKSQGQARLDAIRDRNKPTQSQQTHNPNAAQTAVSGASPVPTSSHAPHATTGDVAIPDQAAMQDARTLANSAQTLDELRNVLSNFKGCNLKASAKNTVFSDGNPDAPIMLVGEAPGRDEDQQGLPFVGRAGQLLDKMLAAINLDRTNCYITNIIPWRPPGNRTPVAHEIELCRPFVERHIELTAPKLLVFMGNVSNKTLLNTNKGILSTRGTWSTYQIGEFEAPVMSTLHPAYLLRTPAAKRNAWMDLLAINAKLAELT